jgi:energy-coupling factor transporter ATP-binding protein EcfA2
MAHSFDTWLGSLPKWLQAGAADLLTNQKLNEKGIEALADLCVAESRKEPANFMKVPAGAFDKPVAGITVRLQKINSVKGVNALDPTAALDFQDADMVVIYGANGTGKSGFARLAKEAATGGAYSHILPDVFAAITPQPQATFLVQREGKAVDAIWTLASGPVPELRNLHVFDRDVALSYMNENRETGYEPRRLRFITTLVDLCDRVRDELHGRMNALPTALPATPAELASTPLASAVLGLKPSMTDDDLRRKVQRSANHTARMRELEEALKAPDPEARIKAIDKSFGDLDELSRTVTTLADTLSVDGIKKVTSAKAHAVTARDTATKVAAMTFEQSSLYGVGEVVWQAMWEAAREYSTIVAYPGHAFPHVDDSLCPLCQQAIGPEASQRMIAFEDFVKGEVEAKAKEADALHQRLVQGLHKLPALIDWKARFTVLTDGEQLVETLHKAAEARLTALAAAKSGDDVPPMDFASLLEALRTHRASLEVERRLVTSSLKEGERQKIVDELRSLKMLDWCNNNLPAILKELARKRKIAVLECAARTTNTATLTKKKNQLAQDELTGGYQRRFEQELQALGAGRLRVKPVEARGAKGRVTFGLAITDAKKSVPPAEVLSEGEARVVALAAFLADVTVAGAATPFLFDDPVSSLDIEFEERVVARLFELARTRQVLVFTHRLSLVALLQQAAEESAEAGTFSTEIKPVSFHRIRLERLGARIGLATGLAEKDQAVHEAARDIAEKRIAAAEEHYQAGRVADYEHAVKAICSDLRIVTERAVEDVLINGVVKRFRRSVTTLKRLSHLSKISTEDCAFLEDLMTRLSVFEHSQSDELPATLPDITAIRNDAQRLRDWALEFKKRKVPSTVA